MNKEFVPYQESLELKELGFDEPCFGYYEPSKEFNYINWENFKDFPYLAKNSEWQDLCGASTFSQAFRWFREKYHLIGGIEYIGGATPETTWWDIYVIGRFNINPSEWTMKYQPYEEAELACLRKLIQIVKEKL